MSEGNKKIDIIDSKAPFLVKFGYLCVKKTGIPKSFGIICLIISQLQLLGLYFKIGFKYLPTPDSSITRPFEIFYKLTCPTEFVKKNDDDMIILIGVSIGVILMLTCFAMSLWILFCLVAKRDLSMRIRNFWGFICYVHPLVLFFPIHIGSLGAINAYYYETDLPFWMPMLTGYSYFAIVINFLLAFFNFTVFYSNMRTKDPLASKNSKLRRCEIILKTIVPILMLNETKKIGYLVTILVLGGNLYTFKIFYSTLPFYKRKTLFLFSCLQGLVGFLPIFILVALLFQDSEFKLDLHFVLISFILFAPISLRISIRIVASLLVKSVTEKVENLTPELILQRRYTLGDLIKNQTKINSRERKFDIIVLAYESTYSEYKAKGIELKTKHEVLAAQGSLLRRALELYPESKLLKLTLALHYIRYEVNILKAYNLIEEVRCSNNPIDISISMYLILFQLENYLFEKYSHGIGYVGGGSHFVSELNMLKYIKMSKIMAKLRSRTIEQGKIHSEFWKCWQNQKPDYKELVDLSTKADNLRKNFKNKWRAYSKKIDFKFHDPFLVYGLYLSIIDNHAIEGEKMIEQYHQRIVKTKHMTDQTGLIEDTQFSSDVFHVMMSATKSKMGNIMDCSPNIENILGFKREFLIGGPVTTIMTSFFREKHDKFIYNYSTTGKQRLIDNTHVLPARSEDNYLISCYFHLKINPMVEIGMSYVALMRPVPNMKSYHSIQFREDGYMDSISKASQTLLGISAKCYQDQFCVYEICPELWILGELYKKKVYESMGRTYEIDYSYYHQNAKKYYKLETNSEMDTSLQKSKNVSFDLTMNTSSQRKSKRSGSILKKPESHNRLSDQAALFEDGMGYQIDPKAFESDPELIQLVEKIFKFEGHLSLNRKTKISNKKLEKSSKVKVRCGIFGRYYDDQILLFFRFYYDHDEKKSGSDKALTSVGDFEVVHSNNFDSNTEVRDNDASSMPELNLTVSSAEPSHTNPTERLQRPPTFGELNLEQDSIGVERDEKSLTIDHYHFDVSNNFPETHQRESLFDILSKLKGEHDTTNDPVLKTDVTAQSRSKFEIPKIRILEKFNPIFKKIVHKVKDPKLQRKATVATENDMEQIAQLKQRLRRRVGTHIIHKEAGLNYQSSSSSSVSSRTIKVEVVLKKALETIVEARWVKALQFGFLLIVLLTMGLYFSLYVLINPNYEDWLHRKNVVENSFSRIDSLLYFDQYVQIFNAGLTNFYDFSGDIDIPVSGDFLKQLLGIYALSYATVLKSANDNLTRDIGTLDNHLQPIFFQDDVTIYDIDENWNFYESYTDNVYRSVSNLVQKCLAVVNYVVELEDVPEFLRLKDLEFILKNTKNSLIYSMYTSSTDFSESIKEDINLNKDIYGIIITFFYSLLGFWGVLQLRFFFKLLSDSSYFGLIFLKFKNPKINKHEHTITIFIQALKREANSKSLLKNLDFAEEENDANDENDSIDQKSNNRKLYRQPDMKKTSNKYLLIFARLIPMAACFVYFLIDSKVQFVNNFTLIYNLENQIVSSLNYLVKQSSLTCQILEIFSQNSTTTFAMEPINLAFENNLEVFADITSLVNNFKDESNNYQLDPYQQKIFYNISCAKFANGDEAYYNLCVELTDQKGYTSLIEISSRLSRVLKLKYESYLEGPKNYTDLQNYFSETIQEANVSLSLSRGLLVMLYQQVSANYNEAIDSSENNLLNDFILKDVFTFALAIILWNFCIKILSSVDKERKNMMKMVPIPVLLENRYVKSYLIDHSGDELKTYRSFI